MAIRRLSGSSDEFCEDRITCPGVWEDDDYLEDVVAVGTLIRSPKVPLGPGEVAIRLPRRVIGDAKID